MNSDDRDIPPASPGETPDEPADHLVRVYEGEPGELRIVGTSRGLAAFAAVLSRAAERAGSEEPVEGSRPTITVDPDGHFSAVHVACVPTLPDAKLAYESKRVAGNDWLGAIGCLIVVAVVILLCVLGTVTLFRGTKWLWG